MCVLGGCEKGGIESCYHCSTLGMYSHGVLSFTLKVIHLPSSINLGSSILHSDLKF